MSYKFSGSTTLLDTLVLTKNDVSKDIIIKNNEPIIFDMIDFNDDFIKITLNYGDNSENDTIVKPIYAASGAINVESIKWAAAKHYFAFKNEDDIAPDNDKDFTNEYTKKIEVKIYGIDEKVYKNITIRYKVEKNAITGISRPLTLLNANIRNDGKIAYTIQNDNDRQIIFFTSSDNVLKYIHEES